MQRLKDFFKKNWAIILILVVATFLRFYQLDQLPPGLYPDEAANGLDIIRMMEEGDHRVVYDTNGPRESLFFYAQGIFVWLGDTFNIEALNYTPLALRIAPAILGVMGVWALYLFAKELFNKNIALFSSAALAVSAWHIQFSRNGFRAIVLPLILCLIFYHFIKAYRNNETKNYVWFGIFLALGFYTYLSIRMLPFIFIALWVWTLFFNRGFVKKNMKNILWASGAFLVAMIPMLIHFAYVPADIFGRSSTSIFNPELNNGSALRTLGDNIIKEIKMFNFEGDRNFRHNLGGSPMLDIVTGIFFWFGIIVSLIKFKKIEHFLLFAWLGAMSLPMILTAEGIPHALRLVGAIPVIFIWIGLGINFLIERINNRNLKYGAVALIFLIAGFLGFKKYFVDFPTHVEAREAYSEDMVVMGYDIREASADRTNIMITGGFGLKTVSYLTHGVEPQMIHYEIYQLADEFTPPSGNYKIFVARTWLEDTKNELMNAGYWYDFQPVRSEFDERILYYEYES
jgi:4-amino-4-deoxy-L-arabinose transferase-like glycosyltransferase